jgi:hypothetical protein
MLTLWVLGGYRDVVDIEASARKHGVPDEEGTAVIHAMRARGKFLEGWWIE